MKTTLLYLHGFGGHKNSEKEFLKELNALDIDSKGIDLTGFGSNFKKRGYIDSITDFYNDISREEAKLNKNDSNILCGYSMGGIIGLHYFLKYPSKFNAFVGLAPGIKSYKNSLKNFLFARFVSIFAPKLTINAGIISDESIKTDKLLHDKISAKLYLTIIKMQKEVWKLAKENQKKILIFHAKSDPTNLFRASKEFCEKAPSAKLLIVDDSYKHGLHKKNPKYFAKKLLLYLNLKQ